MRVKIIDIEITGCNAEEVINAELSKLGNQVIDITIQSDLDGKKFAIIKYQEKATVPRSLYEITTGRG